MTQPSTISRLKVIFAVALLLGLGPMWLWNERVACLPLGLSLEWMPGQLLASRSPIYIRENLWFDGGSSRRAVRPPMVMTIDLRTGRWTTDQQPMAIVQNSQRFTFEDVPSMNGYLVHVEDLHGVQPTRKLKVNVTGHPLLVNARYLVWSRRGYFEVVDLSVDESKLAIAETENSTAKNDTPLKAIPGSNCFYSFSRWTTGSNFFAYGNSDQIPGAQLILFKIENGRVVPLSEWAIHGLEVSSSGGEVLTHAGDETIQIHSLDDGRLVTEVRNPFGLSTAARLHGRLLLKPGSTRCFDLKTQREFTVPFKVYQPQAMNDSIAVFLSNPNTHPSHLWVYDFEKGSELFHTVLPKKVEQVHIDGDHLIAVGHAHAITAYTIDLASGKILRTLQPYRLTSRSAGLLALCFGLWCVAWVWLQPTGRPWVELGLVLAVVLFGLRPYQSYPQTMVILLVTSGFALWHACLSPGEFKNGISRSLFLGVAGLYFLQVEPLQSRYVWLLGFWWLLVLLLQVFMPWWLGFRLINERTLNRGASRTSILHLLCLMTIAALLVVGWPGIDWVWRFIGAEAYLIVAVATTGCLLGLTSWLGLSPRRWWSYGWLDAVLAILLLLMIVFPRLCVLWYGHSIFDRLDANSWSTLSDFLSKDSDYPFEILWESAAICLVTPYLLGVALRYQGTVWHKPSKSASSLPNSGQASESVFE